MFFHYSIRVNKCSGSCNNVNDPYLKRCVSNVVKDADIKIFNLMSRTNKTRHIKLDKICKRKCRLDASICNMKQRWNNDKM